VDFLMENRKILSQRRPINGFIHWKFLATD
jgi:hypothetical protein